MKFDGKDVLLFGTAVAIGVVGVPALIHAWRKRRPKPPVSNDAKWKYVGTLDALTIYPLKSGKGLNLQAAYCSERGPMELADDTEGDNLLLKDRYFLLFREDNGEQLTGKTFPVMFKISVKAEGKDCVRFSFPGKWDLIVQIPKEGRKMAKIWRLEPIGCFDCGDEASIWMTEIIKSMRKNDEEQIQIRLGYWPPKNALRNLKEVGKDIFQHFPDVSNDDSGAYSDFTSYMLMTSSSMDELNRRMDGITLTPRQFRPNFFVKTDEKPFSDLTWKWVKIGNIIFRYVKGCQRCALVTYDPETSLKYPNNEPLTTLNRMDEAKVTKPLKESPMMGIHLGYYNSGIVKIGDPVYAIIN